MDIKFARIRFDNDLRKYYIKPITSVKENEDDDDKNHIMPLDANDFDTKKTYYSKFALCDRTCVNNHDHYIYQPCRILLLGGISVC